MNSLPEFIPGTKIVFLILKLIFPVDLFSANIKLNFHNYKII